MLAFGRSPSCGRPDRRREAGCLRARGRAPVVGWSVAVGVDHRPRRVDERARRAAREGSRDVRGRRALRADPGRRMIARGISRRASPMIRGTVAPTTAPTLERPRDADQILAPLVDEGRDVLPHADARRRGPHPAARSRPRSTCARAGTLPRRRDGRRRGTGRSSRDRGTGSASPRPTAAARRCAARERQQRTPARWSRCRLASRRRSRAARPRARSADTFSNARQPSLPSASKNAACGLTATTYGATASTMPLQNRSTAVAAAALPAAASPRSSTGSRSTTGSSPTTSCVRFRSTASARRSANGSVGAPAASLVTRPRVSRPRRARIAATSSGTTPKLRWRPSEERRDEPHLVGVLGCTRERRLAGGRDESPRLVRGPRRRAPISAPPPRDRRRSRDARTKPGSRAGTTMQARSSPQPLELRELRDHVVERRDPVAQPRSVLEALLAAEPPQRGHGARGAPRRIVVRLVAVERAGGAARDRRPANGPSGRRLLAAPSTARRAAEVDVAIGPRARVRSPAAAARAAAAARRAPLRARSLSPATRRASSAPSAASTAGRCRSPEKYDRSRARRSRARPT